MTATTVIKHRHTHVNEPDVRTLLASRANLKHLIYSMEHDRSLNAEFTKIISLIDLLSSIEHQLDEMRSLQN